ncbi:polycystic kidney disease 2-like 1 protein [Episyrphus balteatus]|uniref:polycystic kidney disease 2-like 1 protein n=1 Tax=Episyrphus balteatus TaxID=286459 RepID=UPI002484E32B|nr:polycystic kidney disease 2-like 1 protein [Episyrphus balteatus]
MENRNTNFLKYFWIQVQTYSCREIQSTRKESTIFFDLLEVFIFILFLIATTIVSLSTRNINMFHYEKALEKQFIVRSIFNEYGFEMTYNDLITVADWWSFIETTFIESISEFDNHNDNNKSAEILPNNVILGVPRLRQIRVRNETCAIHGAFRNQFKTCYGEFSKINEETNEFLNNTHTTADYNNNQPVWGKISTYSEAGYIEELSLIREETEATLEQLKSSSWIDRGTRMVLLEFVSYNANVNLLCKIKMMVEFIPSGGILTSSSIQPLKYSILCEGLVECFCVLLFYVIVLFYTLEIVLKVTIMGVLSITHSIWSVLDIFVVALAYFSLFYFVWHTKYLKNVLNAEEPKAEDVFKLDIIFYWNMYFNTAMGISVFAVWIKTFNYLQMNEIFLQFSSTIKQCSTSLFGFSIMFGIVFVAYADLSVLLFGTTHADFRDFSSAMLTMMRMVLGDLYYSEMEEASPILGPIYFLSYILFVFFILLNMFLAIINDTFSAVKSEKTIIENKTFKDLKEKLLMIKNRILSSKTEMKNSNKRSFTPETDDTGAHREKMILKSKEHLSQSQAYTYSISGSITNYHGAGFIEMLDFDKENNENVIAELKDALWVDTATRIILIEFILFNSNVNLFCNAKFLAEIPPTGGIITSSQLQALKYSPLWHEGGYLNIFCSAVLFGLILYYTLEMVRNVVSKGFMNIFGSIFNLLDSLVLLIGYSAVVYITWHTFYLKSILKKYEQDYEQFLSLDIIFYWNGLFIDQMGIFIFIVWIQIFKYTKFNKTMMQFITTLQRCAKDLIGFSIMFSIVFIAFALLAVLIFGSTHSDFCNFSKAILTLMRTVLGDFDFDKLEAANRFLGPIFFISFIIFVFFILMNMFLAIINDTYSDVKSEIIEERENQLQDYIKSLLERLKRLIIKNSNDKTSKKSDDQDSQVSRISSEPSVEEKDNNYDTIIDKYFETISSEREDIDEDLLTERVSLLETKLEKVIGNLDDILNKYEEKSKK